MDLVLLIYLLWNSVRLFHPVLTYMGHLHFDNGRTSKNYDVPHEHGGLPNVPPVAVHLKLFLPVK